MRKNAGFTMIELLAAVVILGILMGIAVPAVTGLLRDQRNKTYIADAIRLSTLMDRKIRSDNKMGIPAKGSCVAMSLTYLDDNTFNEAPYNGEYERGSSFVVALRNNNTTKYGNEEYVYYVRLVEKLTDTSYRGIDLVSVNDDNLTVTDNKFLYMEKAKDNVVTNFSFTPIDLDEYKSGEGSYTEDDLKNYLGDDTSYNIDCDSIDVYAPDIP